MAGNKGKIEVILSMLDKATAPFQAFNRRLETMQAPLRKINNQLQVMGRASGFDRVANQLGGVAMAAGNVAGQLGRIAAAGGIAGFAFKRAFIDVAAEFQRFELILETIEGDQGKAKAAMNWISDFSAKTPFELAEVTDAFVKLRTYGLDPTQGLLKSLGDTSAAMGKPIMSAVEAIADAMTGENERLKEFGIRATKHGDKIVYEYAQNGKTIRAAANASNRAQIQATLEAIWNQKYAGAMDKLSGSWGGMMSNISDQWTRFAKMVMDSGPFQNLRTRLAAFLARLDSMAKSGQLAKIAEEWGKKITQGIDAIFSAGKRVAAFLTGFVDTVGGVGNALKIVAAVAAGPLLLSIGLLAKAFIGLGIAMLTTPFGWIMAALAGVIALGVALATNFGSMGGEMGGAFGMVGDAISLLWETFKEFAAFLEPVVMPILKAIGMLLGGTILVAVMALTGALKALQFVLSPVVAGLSKVYEFGGWIGEKLFGSEGGSQQASGASGFSLGPSAGVAPVAAGALGSGMFQTNTNNAKVELDFKNVPRGLEVTPAANNSAPLDLSMGYTMATP